MKTTSGNEDTELAGESTRTLRAAEADGVPGLLPCPFCGGKAAWSDGEQKTVYGNDQAYCTDCYASAAPELGIEQAAIQWNSRAQTTDEPNLIGHYVVKIYAHDDCPAEDRKRLKNAFAGLHDEVESVFSVQVEGEDWEHDIQYEVTNEMPWEEGDDEPK